MFIDYYELLELSSTATSNEVKTAFRQQALKWHPDKNPGVDTTLKMQLINEAKLILLDTEAREKYDKQYLKFKLFQSTSKNSPDHKQQKTQSQDSQAKASSGGSHTSFEFDDELLKKWMRNAKTQAVDLAKQTIDELGQMSKTGIREGMNAMGNALLSQIVISVMVLLIIALIRGCS
jgi:curved DNA-binding protein CbpA